MSAPSLVADSGPLIALARVDLLTLPSLMYATVGVPAAVWEEILRKPPERERMRLLVALDAGNLKAATNPPQSSQMPRDPRLGAGKRAAIDLARVRGAHVPFDERRNRRAASDAGLLVVGTLGMLVRERQSGFAWPLRPIIDRLRRGGYHLADDLVVRAMFAPG